MNSQIEQGISHHYTITLEIASEDPKDSNPALVDAVGRDTTEALIKDGFTVEPVYTGQRGGFLVDVLIPFLAATWANKDIILADGSALITLITPVFTLTQYLREAHEKRIGKVAFQQAPIKITVEISGALISIETPDLETAEGAMKLAQRFQTQYPTVASHVTSQSNVKVKGSVPKRPPRKRR
jgi:hypothetical protein